MATYYHVCPKWDDSDLESPYQTYGEDAYAQYAERWTEAGELCFVHAHFIHLHATLAEAQEYQELYGGEILVITDEEEVLAVVTDRDEYPHPIVRETIPTQMITRHE